MVIPARVVCEVVGLALARSGAEVKGAVPPEGQVFGSPGTQAALLPADRAYILPRFLYEVRYERRTIVPPGTIGVVVAEDGLPAPLHLGLSAHVECNFFQDGRAFLLGGG